MSIDEYIIVNGKMNNKTFMTDHPRVNHLTSLERIIFKQIQPEFEPGS